jgi:hypothetical protein
MTTAVEIRRFGLDELRTTLDELLTRGAQRRRIIALETRPLPYASSFAIEELNVQFEDGGTACLVCKDTGHAAMLPEAQRVRPGFLHNPLREIATYESILAPCGIGPRFYGSLIDQPRGRYWLFLERVSGPPLAEVGDFDVWRRVSGWLARMHSGVRWKAVLARADAAVPLVQYDRALFRLWMQRARRYLLHRTAEPRSRRTHFDWLASQYEAVIEELAALPAGFVHGELFASNVLVETATRDLRVRPLDWELAGFGPVFIDLATLTAGTWTDDQRTELALSYHAELNPQSEVWLPRDAFMRALDCCRVQLAVQQIGWAKQRVPPATHTQDWLGEALHAAEKIGL